MKPMKVPTHNSKFDMYARPESKTDLYVIREQFCENVYQVKPSDLEDTKIVVDIGANIGAFSLYIKSICEDAIVHAFEPERENSLLLEMNLNDQHDCYIHGVGVSDYNGKALLTPKDGDSHLVEEDFDGETQEIPLISLKEVLEIAQSPDGFVDVLKIDVEGSEYDIIRGGHSEGILDRFRYIAVEFSDDIVGFGEIVTYLAHTHRIEVIGKPDKGGYIYARRY